MADGEMGARSSAWEMLPSSALLALGSYLAVGSILSARQVCRSWRDGLGEVILELLLDSQNLDAARLAAFKRAVKRVFPKARRLTLDVGCSLPLTEEQAAEHARALREVFATLAESPQISQLRIVPAALLKYAVAQRVYGALSAGLHALPAPLRSLSLDITALPEAHDLPQPAAWMALTQLRMLDASWQHGKICRTSSVKPQHITLLAALTNLRSLQVCVPRPVPPRPPQEPSIGLEQVNAAVASLAALTSLEHLHVRGYGNSNYAGLHACLPALARLRSLKLQHAEPGLSGLQGLFIENPTPFALDCLAGLQLLTRLEVQAATEVTLADWRVLAGLPLLRVLHLEPANLAQEPAAGGQPQQQHQQPPPGWQQEGQQQAEPPDGQQQQQQQQQQQAPGQGQQLDAEAELLVQGGGFPALQELAITLPAAQLHHLAPLTSLTSLALTSSDRATSRALGSVAAQLASLRRLRSLQLLRKPSLPSLLRLGPACLSQLVQLWPGLQALTLHVQVQQQAPAPAPAWQPLQQLAQLAHLALVNTSAQPAHLCPSQLPAALRVLRLVNVGPARGSVPVAQALPALRELALCMDGEAWGAAEAAGFSLAVGSRLQALELDQVPLGCAALQQLLSSAAQQLTRLELVNRHEWTKQAGAEQALCSLSQLTRLRSLRLILDSQDRAANWFPPPLMSSLLSLAGLRTLVLGLGPRFTYDHGLWQGSRAFTALTALGGLRRLDVHDLSSDIRGAFQEHAPHCRFNHHQYFRAE